MEICNDEAVLRLDALCHAFYSDYCAWKFKSEIGDSSSLNVGHALLLQIYRSALQSCSFLFLDIHY